MWCGIKFDNNNNSTLDRQPPTSNLDYNICMYIVCKLHIIMLCHCIAWLLVQVTISLCVCTIKWIYSNNNNINININNNNTVESLCPLWISPFQSVVATPTLPVLDSDNYKLLYDFNVYTNRRITARRPDLVFIDKHSRCTKLIDMAFVMDIHIIDKHREKAVLRCQAFTVCCVMKAMPIHFLLASFMLWNSCRTT